MKVSLPTSVGDLIDRYTILTIKSFNIKDFDETELNELEEVYKNLNLPKACDQYRNILLTINEEIWEVENFNREMERQQDFGQAFIESTRSVYMLNDLRAQVKRLINKVSGSHIHEYKSHEGY